jgi:hypothetical protein
VAQPTPLGGEPSSACNTARVTGFGVTKLGRCPDPRPVRSDLREHLQQVIGRRLERETARDEQPGAKRQRRQRDYREEELPQASGNPGQPS